MTTYEQFRLEHGISAPKISEWDLLHIDKAADFNTLLSNIFSSTDWFAFSALLKLPNALNATLFRMIEAVFYQNLSNPYYYSVDHLMALTDTEKGDLSTSEVCVCLIYLRFGLPSVDLLLQATPSLGAEKQEQAVLAQLIASHWAAKTGHVEFLKRLMRDPRVSERATERDNRALVWASENGHLPIIEFLLDHPEILKQAANYNNWCVRLAVRNGHHHIVNRLMQEPIIRVHSLARLEVEGYKLIYNGLKRAFWLDLQKQPGFDRLSSLTDFKEFCSHYLEVYPEWLNDSFDMAARQKFIPDICQQVLELGRFKPFFRSTHLLTEQWQHIDNFLNLTLPDDLSHFQDVKFTPARDLASRCLRPRQAAAKLQSCTALALGQTNMSPPRKR